MILRTCVQILMLLICATIAWSQPQPTGTVRLNDGGSTNTKAVVVGISDYQHINDLKYADDDAIALASYLVAHPDVEEQNILLLLNDQATKNNVARAIYTTLSQAKKGEQVIIYFAGHGDANNAESLVDAGYLLCHGVSKYALYEIDEAINIANIQNWADAAAEKGVYVVLMIDACRAGRFVDNNSQATVAKALSGLAQGFQKSIKLISCQPDQLSYEDAKWGGGHGVFTHYLLQGLKGAAIDTTQAKNIEVYDLFKYIEEQTVADTERKQIPLRGGNSTHKLLRFYKAQNNPMGIDTLMLTPLPRNNLSKKSAIDLSKDKVSQALGHISGGTYKNLSEDDWKQAIKAATKLAKKADSEEEQNQYAFHKSILEAYATLALEKEAEYDKMETMAEVLYASNKNSANLFNLLGELAQAKNQQEKAIYYFNESKQLAGNWLQPHTNLVTSYLAKDDFEIAYRVANEHFSKFRLSATGVAQLESAYALASGFLQDYEKQYLKTDILKVIEGLDRQDDAEREVFAMIENLEKSIELTKTSPAASINFESKGEAILIAKELSSLKDLKAIFENRFAYSVDNSAAFSQSELLNKISYKSTGYDFEAQEKPKFIYLSGHIYQDNTGQKYLLPSASTSEKADFKVDNYLTVTEILETVDRTPNKQVLLVLDVDNPELLDFSSETLKPEAIETKAGEKEAETHKRAIAERHKNLARYLIVPQNNGIDSTSQFIATLMQGLNAQSAYGIMGLGELFDKYFNQLDKKPVVSAFGYHEGGDFLFINSKVAEGYNAILFEEKIEEGDGLLDKNEFVQALEVYQSAYDYILVYSKERVMLDGKIAYTEFLQSFYLGYDALQAGNCEEAKNHFLEALSIMPNDSETLQKIIECDACMGKKSAGIEE